MRLLAALLIVGAIMACASFSGSPKGTAPSAPATPEEIENTAHAVDLLRGMATFLRTRERLSMTAEIGYSAVQADGQKIEFGGSRNVSIRRPDRARMESHARDGVTRFLYFDRGSLSGVVPNQRIHAAAEVPKQLDDAIDFVVRDLKIPMPLAELVHSSYLTEGIDRIISGFVVGEEVIGGVRCEHVAFRSEGADVQIWIAHGPTPVPRRIVISYRDEPGAPEFWAQFERWDLVPDLPDEIFIFTPPPNALQVSFDELLDRVPLPPGGDDD